jgi:hypothetical protein
MLCTDSKIKQKEENLEARRPESRREARAEAGSRGRRLMICRRFRRFEHGSPRVFQTQHGRVLKNWNVSSATIQLSDLNVGCHEHLTQGFEKEKSAHLKILSAIF